MITREEILAALNEFNRVNDLDPWNIEEDRIYAGGLKLINEEQVGGEGQGEHYHLVTKVSRDDDVVYIKHDGYYDSWNGREFDGMDSFKIVEPYMKQVRDWKKV